MFAHKPAKLITEIERPTKKCGGSLAWLIARQVLLWDLCRLLSAGMPKHFCQLFNAMFYREPTGYSDQWAAYSNVGNIPGLENRSVNHSLFFVDPVTGVHTQNIESYWNRCKVKLKHNERCSVRREMLPGYLDEFWCGGSEPATTCTSLTPSWK